MLLKRDLLMAFIVALLVVACSGGGSNDNNKNTTGDPNCPGCTFDEQLGVYFYEPPDLGDMKAYKENSGTWEPVDGFDESFVSCYEDDSLLPQKGEQVKLMGDIDVFGLKTNTRDLNVEVYSMDITTGKKDQLLASTVTIQKGNSISDGYYDFGETLFPTGEPLIFFVYGSGDKKDKYFDTYRYYIYLDKNMEEQDGYVHFAANIVSQDSVDLIPTMAGYPNGISPGHGALAGEIRDCYGNQLENVVIGFAKWPPKMVYTDGTDNHYPKNDQLATNKDGLYIGIDFESGENIVAAKGTINGKTYILGVYRIFIEPDSINILSFDPPKARDQQGK